VTTDVRSNAPGDHDAIDLEAFYPHPVELVWRALTEPAALATWLMTNDFQAKVGHRFTFRTDPAPGFDGIVRCRVLDCEPPRRLAYTWRGMPELPETMVSWSLEPVPGGTRLRLVHSGFAADPALAPLRDLLGGGWRSKLLAITLPDLLGRLAAGSRPQGAP
jgi:uncharacterized protein YndB with AHSA1/START domain